MALGISLSSTVGLRLILDPAGTPSPPGDDLGITLSSTVGLRRLQATAAVPEVVHAWNRPEQYGWIATEYG